MRCANDALAFSGDAFGIVKSRPDVCNLVVRRNPCEEPVHFGNRFREVGGLRKVSPEVVRLCILQNSVSAA